MNDRGRKWDPKGEAVRLWEADPCGSVAGLSEGTPEFFVEVERERYERYAPWLSGAVAFERFRGMCVLEIGCGIGTDLVQFWRCGAKAVAIDLVGRHLEITKKRLMYEGHPVWLARADAESLPLGSEVFDCVYSFGVLHHTPGVGRALDEIYRILRKDGRAIIALYHRSSAFYWVHTILARGILLGRLLRKGYRRLLSEIEYHSDGNDALPLVNVYTRREVRNLFRRFSEVKIEAHHLDYNHFLPLRWLIERLPRTLRDRRLIETAGRYVGWYLLVEAKK
jgi:SAM-dependent methyltransferase